MASKPALAMPRTAPLQSGASSSSRQHRRPPAHRSVSLLHSPKKRLSPLRHSDTSSELSNRAQETGSQDSPSSLQPLGRNNSSGESSNADKWFEQSNNEVPKDRATFLDNEPPFFMRNSSSSETPPEVREAMKQYRGGYSGANSLPLHTGLLQLGTDGSSTEDFRSVIDDLTIANKKLKRRLKRYEKLHDSHLKDEKLFEVRVHGLPSDKKRELEEMLRKFAANLGDESMFPTNGYEGLMPLLRHQQTASSQVSAHNPDSAYASMSAGGSAAASGGDSKHKRFQSSAASMRQSIHSYLHHIPEGLNSQPNPAHMTERAKQKLVARRLEQIFSGKGAATGGHQQPVLQEEISQMAAQADRSALESSGRSARQEGAREAQILAREVDVDQDSLMEDVAERRLPAKVGEQDFAEGAPTQSTLEQRPTRPLDLDPYRAQVPSENISYLRQLGFSPPEPAATPREGHGWIYLNVLINMAQLHTINVTPEFVQRAVAEHSNKFELSTDGRKIRWAGDDGYPVNSSSSGANSGTRTSSDAMDGQSPRKRPKLTHRTSSRSAVLSTSQARSGASQWAQRDNNKFVYTPMFFHKDQTDEADDSSSEAEDEDDTSAPYPARGATSPRIRNTTRRTKAADDGPIIFYNNSRFCTDLSGERKPQGNPRAPPYTKASSQPIGKTVPVNEALTERRGPLAQADVLPEPMDLGDNPIPDCMELSFPPSSPLESASAASRSPAAMEVTGIGGVWPADNFSINVQSRHARVESNIKPSKHHASVVPPKFAQMIRGSVKDGEQRASVQEEVVSAKRRELPPSQLPPALSYMPFDDSTPESEDDSDVDEELSDSPPGGILPPSAAPQAMNILYAEDSSEDDDSDYASESSVDFLAAAREVDPEAIRAREREYDANMAERLAEEIPAGSSAATAGGGSGFTSPAPGVSREEYRRAKQEIAMAPRLDRAGTGDSMHVHGTEGDEE